jgi:hypothetical protein
MKSGAGPALSLRAETDRDPATLAGELSEVLGVLVDIESVAQGTLPRSTFKARRATA